jgi:hypothetical protein
MTQTDERLARLETKMDEAVTRLNTLNEKLDGKLTSHEVQLATLKMQSRAVLYGLGFLILGGGGAASLLRVFGG